MEGEIKWNKGRGKEGEAVGENLFKWRVRVRVSQ